MRIEHYRKTDTGWELEVLTRGGQNLSFEAVGFELPFERIYFGVPAGALRAT